MVIIQAVAKPRLYSVSAKAITGIACQAGNHRLFAVARVEVSPALDSDKLITLITMFASRSTCVASPPAPARSLGAEFIAPHRPPSEAVRRGRQASAGLFGMARSGADADAVVGHMARLMMWLAAVAAVRLCGRWPASA